MLVGLPSGAFHTMSSGVQQIMRSIDKIKELGFNLVELHADVEAFYPKRLRTVAMNADLSFNYTVHMPFVDVSLGSPIKEIREASERIVQRVVESVSAFDPIHYVMHPLNLAEERAFMTMFDQRVLEEIEEITLEMHEIVGDYVGVHHKVLLENMERLPIERRMKYLEDYGYYGCFDVGHAVLQGYDPIDVLERVGKYIREIHLHDVIKFRNAHVEVKIDHLPPGVGIVSVGEVIEKARELNVPVIVIEVYNPKYATMASERAKKHGLIRRACGT